MKRLIPIFLLLLASCQLVIDIDVPYGKDKLVANAIQRPDSTWRVLLTHSQYILGPASDFFPPVDDADVVIENPDGSTETLSLTSMGEFRGKSYPQPGQTYKISVTPHSNMDGVEAEMSMPYVVPIVDVQWDSTMIDTRPNRFYQNLDFEFTFNDPPGENYYLVQLVEFHAITYQVQDSTGQVDVRSDTIPHQCPLWLRDAAIVAKEERRSRFADHSFEGRTYTAHFSTRIQESEGQPLRRIELQLISISKELFQYEETKTLSLDVMGDPFAQPVQVYSNFTNGFGIFGGSAFSIVTYPRHPKTPE